MTVPLARQVRYDVEDEDGDLLPHSLDAWWSAPTDLFEHQTAVGIEAMLPKAMVGAVIRGGSATRRRFVELTETWRNDTRRLSSVAAASRHPAFLGIVGLGLEAVHLIGAEIERDPSPMWFPALIAIVGHDEAYGAQSVNEACGLWIQWIRENGYMS